MSQVEIDFNVKDLGNISEGVDITVPPVYLAFIQIRLVTRGEKEKIKRLLETPSNLRGCHPHQNGVVSKECMVNGLYPCF